MKTVSLKFETEAEAEEWRNRWVKWIADGVTTGSTPSPIKTSMLFTASRGASLVSPVPTGLREIPTVTIDAKTGKPKKKRTTHEQDRKTPEPAQNKEEKIQTDLS